MLLALDVGNSSISLGLFDLATKDPRPTPVMTAKLSAELLDAFNGRGGAVKKREDTHRMADANKAFSHYRW